MKEEVGGRINTPSAKPLRPERTYVCAYVPRFQHINDNSKGISYIDVSGANRLAMKSDFPYLEHFQQSFTMHPSRQ